MLFIKLVKWGMAALIVLSVVRILLRNKGGWTGIRQWLAEKCESWYKIPVIGVLLRIIFKLIKVVFLTLWGTLKWICTLPIIRSLIAVIRKLVMKIVGAIARLWAKIVAWSET